jgi:DNA-binding transcriptional LysR family regulator
MESAAAVRLPAPLAEFHRRYPQVQLDLRSGRIWELTADVLSGSLDAALVAEPVSDEAFQKTMIYDEELVMIAGTGHPPIRSPGDVASQTVLAFEHGCPYRLRMQQWFARAGAVPARIIEMTSWHAILGCAAARMGIAVMPRMLLSTFPDAKYLSTHPLPAEINHAPTMLVWRKGAHSPKIEALLEVLREDAGRRPAKRRRA